jgi:hypothetical protein
VKFLYSFLKTISAEILVIFALFYTINNHIGYDEKTLNADGVGYYDYLPSLFIHKDLVRFNSTTNNTDSDLYSRIQGMDVYVQYKDFKVNKYPIGTAILQTPFFLYTYFTTHELQNSKEDGYQNSFHKSVFFATIFYLFLALVFLKKTLQLYDIQRYIIILCQVLIVLATSVIQYSNSDAGFSHIYSLFAISAFVYFVKSYFLQKNNRDFYLACFFLGLILILRQSNLLILLAIPFLAGSLDRFLVGICNLFESKTRFILGFLLVLVVFSLQIFVWYLQTGSFFVYSYQGESFDFSNPHFFDILFSYKKGLFVYTPVLFVCMFGLVWYLLKKKFYLLITWLFFFISLTFVLSSWWSWFYGCSYGLRAYIEFYPLFFIPFACMLNGLRDIYKICFVILTFPLISINVIQTYQYKTYILHWIDMDSAKYWKTFLKRGDNFKGMVWKEDIDYSNFYKLKEIEIGNLVLKANTQQVVFKINSKEFDNFNQCRHFKLVLENDFQDSNFSSINVSIDEIKNQESFFWDQRYLIHFQDVKKKGWHPGHFNYRCNKMLDNQTYQLKIIINSDKNELVLKNIKVIFYGSNEYPIIATVFL